MKTCLTLLGPMICCIPDFTCIHCKGGWNQYVHAMSVFVFHGNPVIIKLVDAIYQCRWKLFFFWSVTMAHLCRILFSIYLYLLSLKQSWLSLSSMRVYLAAISANHLPKQTLVFSPHCSGIFWKDWPMLFYLSELPPPLEEWLDDLIGPSLWAHGCVLLPSPL